MNGLELIQRGRNVSSQIQFVVVSGYAEFAYAQKALTYGAVAYCLKPFDEMEISGVLVKINKTLDGAKPRPTIRLSIFWMIPAKKIGLSCERNSRSTIFRIGARKGISSPSFPWVRGAAGLQRAGAQAENRNVKNRLFSKQPSGRNREGEWIEHFPPGRGASASARE